MALVKIIDDYGPAEGWRPGDVVDISNPYRLIEEGKVELYVEPKKQPEEPEEEVVSDNTDSPSPRAKSSKKKSK